jgi:hypothetical protein
LSGKRPSAGGRAAEERAGKLLLIRKTIKKISGLCARGKSENGTAFFPVTLPDLAETKDFFASTLVNSGSNYPKFQTPLSDTFCAAFFRVIESKCCC